MSTHPDLSGQCVFITGAARGLGKSMAATLAACGATVGIADLVLAECEAVAEEIRGSGGKAHAYAVDVAVRKLFMAGTATFAARCGRIDAVVNNAMLLKYEPVEQISDETLTRMTAIGINGSVWGAQALLAHYEPSRGGALINMASPVAVKGFPNTAAYSAVKGAIVTLTKVLAAELGPRNVRVNAIAPGSVPTPGALGLNDPAEYERRKNTIPLRRLGKEQDNADACAFLLSAQASFINGEILHVDGGIAAAGVTMAKQIPEYAVDIFSRESVRNANAVDDQLREFAPVVKLPGEDVFMLARFEHVAAGLKDWRSYSSTSRPWHDPDSVRPELLLTDDPPKHTGVRNVVSAALSPAALNRMAEAFRADARAIVGALKKREGDTIDAVAEITQAFVYKVLPDLIGLPLEGRQHMSAFGNMVWATMGPMNELFHEAMRDTSGEVLTWAGACCKRENLSQGSLGMAMYEAADRGEVTMGEAELLVGILLSAAADTTVITLANTLRAFCEFPEEFQRVKADRSLCKAAFEESLRWDSPSRMAGRITTRDIEIEDYVIPAGTRCGLMFAAANRDPRRWPDPCRFDVKRPNTGHLGFGFGVHACVGRVLALLEAEALLGAVAESVASIEATGAPEPWITTVGHGPAKLPVRLRFS